MLRLLLDAHAAPRVARKVHAHRPDCSIVALSTWEDGAYREADDELILTAAASMNLTLVTYDRRTIAPLLMDWYQRGRSHGGVILVDERSIAQGDVGRLLQALVRLWDTEGQMDWENQVLYLQS